MRRIFTSLLILLTTTGCIGAFEGCGNSTLRIEDYYEIRKHESLPDIDGRNILYCKLGYEGDPFINNVEYVEWDESLIKLRTQEQNYYIIKAKKEKLCCGCGDSIIGPVNKKQYLISLELLGKTEKLKNTKELSE